MKRYYLNHIWQIFVFCLYSGIMDRDWFLEMATTYANNLNVGYMHELLSAICYVLNVHGLSVSTAIAF